MGSAAARPTLTPGLVYGGPQVRDHLPIVSVNPEVIEIPRSDTNEVGERRWFVLKRPRRET